MKISYSWLSNYLHTDLPAHEVAELLTFAGLEVEGVETVQRIKGGLEGLVIGEVKTCQRHPNADKLSLTTVDTGGEALLQIVCGAPNVTAGQRVVVAPVGTTVHPLSGDSFEIKKSKIRGELSEGMICAEDEIGLGASHAGILVLPPDAPVGTSVKSYYGLKDDHVFEIGLTPNRVDAASHIGVARDLSALLNLRAGTAAAHPIQWPQVNEPIPSGNSQPIRVTVEDEDACPRYSGVTIEGITVANSPSWLQDRLKAIGIHPINNIVDITNFVLHECGQPLHAFNADKVKGGHVRVRRAVVGEKFVTLDGVERILNPDDLMICHESSPMCMAGVFGGLESGIDHDTTRVFLESAYFHPAAIRKTGKAHGLKTDASFRYERGADPSITLFALKRAVGLILEIAGGKVVGTIIDHYPNPIQPSHVTLDYDRMDSFIGHAIPRSVVRLILESMGMDFLQENEKGCTVQVPLAKVDVTRPVDLMEEVLRIYGYNAVPLPQKMTMALPDAVASHDTALQQRAFQFLAAQGFQEIFTNSLTRVAYADAPGNDAGQSVAVLNPLSQDLGVLRQDMLYTGLEAIEYNRNRKQSDLRFFEFGKSYHKSTTGYTEQKHLAMFISGNRTEESWITPQQPSGFYQLKACVEQLMVGSGLDLDRWVLEPVDHPVFSVAARFSSGDRTAVTFGQLRRSVLKRFDITAPTFYADIHWNVWVKAARKKTTSFVEIPRYPSVRRDLSMLLDRTLEYAQIERLAFKTEKKLLKEVRLFDVYEGEKMAADKKSCAVAFFLQDEQQTLTDQQIDKVMERLMQVFEKEAGAIIRKG